MRLSILACLATVAACGGSASETPWPAEPDDVNLGPAGEAQREESPAYVPAASSAAGPAAAPPTR